MEIIEFCLKIKNMFTISKKKESNILAVKGQNYGCICMRAGVKHLIMCYPPFSCTSLQGSKGIRQWCTSLMMTHNYPSVD